MTCTKVSSFAACGMFMVVCLGAGHLPFAVGQANYRLETWKPHLAKSRPAPPRARTTDRQTAEDAYARLPLSFTANRGEANPRVDFISQGRGYTLFLTAGEAVLALSAQPKPRPAARSERTRNGPALGAVVRLKMLNSQGTPTGTGLAELPGKVNYFIGNDPTRWRTNVPTYAKVRYEHVYPGVDLVYYGHQRHLEYDFVVAPGGDPAAITLGVDGVERAEIDSVGDLVLHTAVGDIRQRKPVIYQEVNGVRREIAGGYLLVAADDVDGPRHAAPRDPVVAFRVAAYDRTRPLVIDPTLAYSTYLGGSGNDGNQFVSGIAVDAAGNAYVTGSTTSTDFPTTAGAADTNLTGGTDAFVTRLNADGTALDYSTFLGGTGDDIGNGIAVDLAGNAYVTGSTTSSDFPTTTGAFDISFNPNASAELNIDAFVTKLNATGAALAYSTFLGGSGVVPFGGGADEALGIAIDLEGNAYVTGYTNASDFPTTSGAFGRSNTRLHSDVFITKLNAGGTALVYSALLVGSGDDSGVGIAVDGAGNAYVAGSTSSPDFPITSGVFGTSLTGTSDAFVTKLNTTGTALDYSTFLGGSGASGFGDIVFGIAIDAAGNAYVTGSTTSSDFPITSGAFDASLRGASDAFVTKLNTTGTALVYSTFLGGSSDDYGVGIAVDATDHAYVTGSTSSPDFPIAPGAVGTSLGGTSDAFVARVNAAGTALDYSTYLGGSGDDIGLGIAVDAAGHAYVIGSTSSSDFPTTSGGFDTSFNGGNDVLVTKFEFRQQPPGPEGGQFVIGALANHTAGARVNFWGAQWAQNNPMSGGPGPNAFRGFENGTATPPCGAKWTSRPGNSSNPPATVPELMTVIVSSAVTKDGAVISGDVQKIIVVRTEPGYGPSPGHRGYGTVVAVVCTR